MEFPTEFAVSKVVLQLTPSNVMGGDWFEVNGPLSLEMNPYEWVAQGNNDSGFTKEEALDALVFGLKAAAAKLAEITDREDVFLAENMIKVIFSGSASDEVAFSTAPEEEEIVE